MKILLLKIMFGGAMNINIQPIEEDHINSTGYSISDYNNPIDTMDGLITIEDVPVPQAAFFTTESWSLLNTIFLGISFVLIILIIHYWIQNKHLLNHRFYYIGMCITLFVGILSFYISTQNLLAPMVYFDEWTSVYILAVIFQTHFYREWKYTYPPKSKYHLYLHKKNNH